MLDKIMSKSKYIAIFSVLALFLVLGVSYAAVAWTTSNYNIALDSVCFDINYVKGQNINASLGMTDESTYISGNTITMNSNMAFTTVSIELDEDCYDIMGNATIKANITSLSNNFKSGGNAYNKLKYVVVEYDPTDYNNLTMSELEGDTFTMLKTGSINDSGTIDIYSEFLEPGQQKDYLVIFYIADFDVVVSGTFAASIDTEVVQLTGEPISNFTYSIDNNTILLTKYNGTSSGVFIPNTYIVDGVEYSTIVNSGLFQNNTSIEQVYFDDAVLAKYGDAGNMFNYCSNLRKVENLPNNITIMNTTFWYCTSLVIAPLIPDSVTFMAGTFGGCTSLVNAPEIPNSVTDMTATFRGCTSLVNAPEIPNSVTDMNSTFEGCTNLTGTVRINSAQVNRTAGVYYHPFYITSKSITVEVPENSTTYDSFYNNKPNNVTIVTY